MVKATCDVLKFKNVKAQLEKIGLGKVTSPNEKFSINDGADTSKVKIEHCFCGNVLNQSVNEQGYVENSSDDEANGGQVYYSFNKGQKGSNVPERKFKINPLDKFGHVRACAFCKCHYHWLADCPYAPASIKNQISNRSSRNYNNQTL